MRFEEHCRECEEVLDAPFPEVHKYLDQYFMKFPWMTRHRRKLHHKAGIAEVEAKFGHEAAKAAFLHIVSDLKMEGWKPEDGMPVDEADYVRMGLW